MVTTRAASAAQAQSTTLSTKTKYLIAYNATSALLWLAILSRVLYAISRGSIASIYKHNGQFVKEVQSIAVLEILHSLVGLVRSPVLTTAMQVASRLLVVWGIVDLFPALLLDAERTYGFARSQTGASVVFAYAGMLVAWSVTEVVRYGYFVFFLARGQQGVPRTLTWLRYNLFYVLYPLGISGECWLMYSALPLAQRWDQRYAYFVIAVLVIYVPGSYVLFTHMIAQRKRVLRGKGRK